MVKWIVAKVTNDSIGLLQTIDSGLDGYYWIPKLYILNSQSLKVGVEVEIYSKVSKYDAIDYTVNTLETNCLCSLDRKYYLRRV